MIPSDVLDRLYEAPLDEFTSSRGALAAELKSQGNDGAAAELRSFRKPTVSAWAVNQLARREADHVRRLFDLRDEMAAAPNASALRKGVEERKRLLVSLLAGADRILTEAGHAPSANTTERITQTLQAGDTDEDRNAIIEGRLSKDLSPSGFGGFGGFSGFVEERGEGPDAEEAEREETRRRVQALLAEAEAAEEEAKAAADEVAKLREGLKRAEKAAATAEEVAKKARDKADSEA